MVYVFLADGFEIIEALACVDMLRRADIETLTVGVTGEVVCSSCGVRVTADIGMEQVSCDNAGAIVLPGGAAGVEKLGENADLRNIIEQSRNNNIYICAICAAPSVLGNMGMLKGVRATSYPSFMKYLQGADIPEDEFIITNGKFITARGAGVSVDFGLEIVRALAGDETADKIRESIQCK